MNARVTVAPEVRSLIEAVCDGMADDAQLRHLKSLLLTDEEARKLYVDLLNLDAELQWLVGSLQAGDAALNEFIAARQTPEQPTPTFPATLFNSTLGFFSSGWPVAYLVATVICGVSMFIGSLTPVSQPVQVARRSSLPSRTVARPKAELVGRITGMVDCKWAGTAFDSPVVPLGRKYELASGLMEITYDTGARVILQGPVTYEVESKNGGFLPVGKLTGKVITANGKGFSVRTPTATVTDLGTEFGIEVDKTGALETQVFAGTIRVVVLREDGNFGAWRRIDQGEAVRIVAKGATIQKAVAERERFVRQLPRGRVIHDDFDVVRNYLTVGTANSVWDGVLNVKRASRLDTLPTEIDRVRLAGQLVMAVPENAHAGWAEAHRGRTFKNAPYLYVNVPQGDFDARVRIKSLSEGHYSVAGLMARFDDDNFLSVNRNQFPEKQYFATRSELAGVDSDGKGEETHGDCALRLVRMGDAFLASYSVDGGQTWNPLAWKKDGFAAMRRPDMTGPIQLGLWYGTFNPIGGAAAFDDFTARLRGPPPPIADRGK